MLNIVPGLITEAHIEHLPDDILSALANICSDIVVQYVNDYVEKNKDSTNPTTKTCVVKVQRAFKSINDKKSYLRSRTAKDIAETLSNLSYVDIYYGGDASLEVLKHYKYCLEVVLDNAGTIDRNRIITKHDCENFILFCENYRAISLNTIDSKEVDTIKRIRKVVKDNKSYFKSAPFSTGGNTIFTKFYNKKETLETLLYGVNFLIEKIEQGAKPESWRYL